MTQYDNEFFRGPPEGSPTLATDQRPTGVEVFQAKPEAATVVADVPVTREEVPKDPPKKKSNARRITKAIKLLASCMAAVVITEAAVNIAATVEPQPEEVPTGQYYVGQWPGVRWVEDHSYVLNMDAVEGNIIQAVLEGKAWRFAAQQDWRMLWTDQTLWIKHIPTGVKGRLNMRLHPYMSVEDDAVYGDVTASTGETLYFRGFLKGVGTDAQYESLEVQQMLMDELMSGLTVTPAVDGGWQGMQIGDKLYSQQSEDWYGLGGYGDLEINIPWVCDSEDYNLENITPYAREKVNGITWSIYFADNDNYLFAVPNIDQGICLGGPASNFLYADAVRRGEEQEAAEWLEKGGAIPASKRRTAVDILIECLQHHYALRERWYPRDWPWKGATDDASYWVWAESLKGTWTQFSFGDVAYRVNSTDPELRFCWETTRPRGDDMEAELEISRMVRNEEEYAISLTVWRVPFDHEAENCAYRTVQATGGETLYLEFRSQYRSSGAEFTTAEMELIADRILGAITFQSNPDDSGWCPLLLCDTMYSPGNMEWSGWGIVGSNVAIRYIHTVDAEGLKQEKPIGTRTHNGITWTLYYDPGDENWYSCIWAVPDIEPDVCIGFEAISAVNYYRDRYTDLPTYGWDDDFKLPAEDLVQAAETVSEALSYIYPLGVEPETEEDWYIPDWPTIHQITTDHTHGVMEYSRYGTYTQFSLGDASYRLDSNNSHLRFFWNETTEVNGAMQADIYVNHVTNNRPDWRLELFVQNEPFDEPRDESDEIDAMIPAPEGSNLYLRFSLIWYGGHGEADPYEVFSGWVQTVMNAITASPADPNGWGQVWICDLMTTPLSENWDGNAMVTDDYEIPYFNRAEEQGLWELDPYGMQMINGIRWTFIYEEADDIIWGLPDFDLRPDVQWCIGAPAREMAEWFVNKPLEEDYLDAAVEGLIYGLSKYYPRRGFEMEPVEGGPDWPSILAADNGDDITYSIDSWQNTDGLFSLNGSVFEIESYREDLRFLWEWGDGNMAQIDVYSMGDDHVQWAVTMSVQMFPFESDGNDYRSLRLRGGETMYLHFESWRLDDTPLEVLIDEIIDNTAFDYCGKEENWHTVYIGNTLQTQQHYDWNGLGMVYENYVFWYLHDANAYDVHQQDYEGQRTINGILWTFRFHKDNDVLYAYPHSEPNLCIGADPNMLYQWYEAEYGAQDDYFETLVESMSVGLQNYYLRPGVEIEPVRVSISQTNPVQFSLGGQGYRLTANMDTVTMHWPFSGNYDRVEAAELVLTANGDFDAEMLISKTPIRQFDNRNHGQIQTENGETLYWYCTHVNSGDEAQLADLMRNVTVTEALPDDWNRFRIEESIDCLQGLRWTGLASVEPDCGRNIAARYEWTASLDLGNSIFQREINGILWDLYIGNEQGSDEPYIWAVPGMSPPIAIGIDYENAVYKYFEDRGMKEDFDGNIWSAESMNSAAEVIFEVLQNYYPR